jgi:hypothetical protein
VELLSSATGSRILHLDVAESFPETQIKTIPVAFLPAPKSAEIFTAVFTATTFVPSHRQLLLRL